MYKGKLFFVAMVAVTFLSGSSLRVNAATITLNPVADTSLFQNSPNNNLGGHTNFAAGTMANGALSRAVMKFDPGAFIPSGSIITSVTLTLNVTTAASSSGSTFELHPLLVNWGEGNKTGQTGAAAATGEATWNARFASTSLWGTPGGQSGTDFSTASSASTSIEGVGSYSFSSNSALVLDVQNWLDNPSSDFGWMLLAQDESTLNTAKRFGSREDGLNRGPVLTIDFTPVPEPSTLGLFGLGAVGLAWFGRRKHA